MLPFGSHSGPPVQRIAAETGWGRVVRALSFSFGSQVVERERGGRASPACWAVELIVEIASPGKLTVELASPGKLTVELASPGLLVEARRLRLRSEYTPRVHA